MKQRKLWLAGIAVAVLLVIASRSFRPKEVAGTPKPVERAPHSLASQLTKPFVAYQNEEAGFALEYPRDCGTPTIKKAMANERKSNDGAEADERGSTSELSFPGCPEMKIKAASADYSEYAGYGAYRGGVDLAHFCKPPFAPQVLGLGYSGGFGFCKPVAPDRFYTVDYGQQQEGGFEVMLSAHGPLNLTKSKSFTGLLLYVDFPGWSLDDSHCPTPPFSQAQKGSETSVLRHKACLESHLNVIQAGTAPREILDVLAVFEKINSSLKTLR